MSDDRDYSDEYFNLGPGETYRPDAGTANDWRRAHAEGVAFPHDLKDIETLREGLEEGGRGVYERMALAAHDEATAAEARFDGAGTEHERVQALGDRASGLARARAWSELACR